MSKEANPTLYMCPKCGSDRIVNNFERCTDIITQECKDCGWTGDLKLEDQQAVFLRPQEGDICVLTFPGRISSEARARMVFELERLMPGVKAVVVSECNGVQSFRPAKGGGDGPSA